MDRRQYLRQFAVLFTGTVAGQLINLASYPLLARLYSPADFGVFATFVAAAAIPGAIACGRFDLAVPTAPKWGRFAILWLCIAMSCASGIVSAAGAALYWFAEDGSVAWEMPLLFGLCVALTGFCAAGSLYLMRHDLYRMSSAGMVMRTAGAVAAQIGLGLVWKTPLSLIVGFAAGLGAQALMLGWTIWSRVPPGWPRPLRMRALFERYKPQVTVDIPSTLIAAVSLNLLTFILATFYGQRVTGFYALAQRIAILPLQLFNDSLSQIFFQKAARAQEERGHFWSEMKFNLMTSGLLSVVVLVLLLLVARPFISVYLGRDWEPAADILILLAPMLAMRSLAMSVATTVFVLRRAHWLLVHNVVNAMVLVITIVMAQAFHFGVLQFLTLAVVLLFIEYGAFASFLALQARSGAASARSS